MIKSMFKRAWLSITRKFNKTVILVITMFVMANLVLASIAIKNAVNESTEYAKETLGSVVHLSVDMNKVREEAMSKIDLNTNGERMRMQLQRPIIYVEMVSSIADSSYVKDFTYGINANAKEGNFIAVETDNRSGMPFNLNNSFYGNIQITGINSYAFINEVQNKSMELITGSYFDENTNDKIIISNELATNNNLKVGDKIKLINEEINFENYNPRSDVEPEILNSKEIELEVIGIYDINKDNFNANVIYMNVETAAKFLKDSDYNDGNYGVENISYFLNNPEKAEEFIKETENKYPSLSDDKLKLEINNEDFDKMAGPIEQVGSFADTLFWIVIIASILIITLIINNNIKDRKYEIGILMSLGGTKLNMITSFLLELIIICTVGFTLSIGTSYFVADTMGKNLLESQIKMSEEQTDNNYGRPTSRGGNFQFRNNKIMNNSNVETIDNIDVTVSINDYAILFIIGYLVSGIAMIIPSINILKYEPKTILTGRQ
ncbi:MAG: FtsX-like permease family protein [Bacilli bacterium]|nr:FtsX-like permease family protein [Bacilli bacterium]MDD4547625.1 FtsX-like permease family protein [Bacilli bacterium]